MRIYSREYTGFVMRSSARSLDFDKKRYPDKKEIDKYDQYAIHFVALDEDRAIVATTRLIYYSPLGYPTLKHLWQLIVCIPNILKN